MDRRTLLKFIPGAAAAASLPALSEAAVKSETLEERRDRLMGELKSVLEQMKETFGVHGQWLEQPSLTYAAFAISYDAIKGQTEDEPWVYNVDPKGRFILMQPASDRKLWTERKNANG